MAQDISIETQDVGLRDLARYFYALKEVWRLRMLNALAQHDELNVSDLAELLDISQPLVSWHLRRLRQARIVAVRRVGRVSYYSLDREQLAVYQSAWDEILRLGPSPDVA
jgi:DNA-binding transcriptional ArsR family regulator